ncbi:MAG: ABC transporter permease [Candidatus Gastranaerophilaceae bacterium]|jgi:ABC-2 type transport system permease protein
MHRLIALIVKEFHQIVRDPSSVLLVVILPCILLFIYGYGVSLDVNKIKVGIVLEDNTPDSQDFATSITHSKYFDAKVSRTRPALVKELVAGNIRGIIIIPLNFTKLLKDPNDIVPFQVIADGSETNTANFVQNYARAVLSTWILQRNSSEGKKIYSPVNVQSRFWYNPELKSRYFLLPGSVAITMTLIGTLLTALVVAREWERGTMEAIMATPVNIFEIILGKLIPYFILGMISTSICILVSIFIFTVPFRGSILALFVMSSTFLIISLEQGLLISTISKNQFVASQMALVAGFLPAYMLSGFIFEISSMPMPIQLLTFFMPARYFVNSLQTLFLVGDIWSIIIPNLIVMLILAGLLFTIIISNTEKRLV